jgi:glycosyltransferase involved in cell wall biosynthesis
VQRVPTVSVILPTFNRTKFLKPAIESVFAQTYRDWELIIADDGSAEETRNYLRSVTTPAVRLLCLEHSGNPSRVRNAAMEAARGRYLAFLDSDDVWAPEKLTEQIRALAGRPGAGWSYTNSLLIDESGGVLVDESVSAPAPPQGWIFEPLLRLEVSISMPTVVAEHALVREIGGFDVQQRFAEWQDLCLRLALRSEVVALPESLCSVRLHDEHYSAERVAAQIDWMRLYQKMAAVVPAAHLRSYCVRQRAQTSLRLARYQADNGDYAGTVTTLCNALPFAWRYPQWWWGALKRIVRPVVPDVLLTARRRRGELPSR